eukprot:7453821-Ditylum_brightwellii.AAC.1
MKRIVIMLSQRFYVNSIFNQMTILPSQLKHPLIAVTREMVLPMPWRKPLRQYNQGRTKWSDSEH